MQIADWTFFTEFILKCYHTNNEIYISVTISLQMKMLIVGDVKILNQDDIYLYFYLYVRTSKYLVYKDSFLNDMCTCWLEYKPNVRHVRLETKM